MNAPRNILLSLAAICLVAGSANARPKSRKKPQPACGLDFLPLFEGAEWTYNFTLPEGAPEKTGLRVDDPPNVHIKVVKVESKGKGAIVTLEETHRKITQTTQIECDKDRVLITPASFFASGEVGGGVGMTMTDLTRKFPTYRHTKGKLVVGDQWREDITAEVARASGKGSHALHSPTHVEMERSVTVAGRETAMSAMNEHAKSVRIDLLLAGRAVTMDKSVSIETASATLWFAPKIGLVRAENRFRQGWQLAETNVGE